MSIATVLVWRSKQRDRLTRDSSRKRYAAIQVNLAVAAHDDVHDPRPQFVERREAKYSLQEDL
jgi:hypothetical protein